MLEIDGRRILTTLPEKIDPQHTAVIVIDCQREFVDRGRFGYNTGSIGGDKSRLPQLMTRLTEFLDQARNAKVRIVHVRAIYDRHYLTDPMYERLHRLGVGHYCQSDDPASGYYPGMEPHAGEPEVIKHRFDAFYDTELDIILKSWKIKTIIRSASSRTAVSTRRHGTATSTATTSCSPRI